jgi:hypothetical protein
MNPYIIGLVRERVPALLTGLIRRPDRVSALRAVHPLLFYRSLLTG